ncbi:secretory carrier-associated membrane protein 4-like [Iris pallida]|uniref:Secretory carrier-associated membrane protein n=1 Tax=Iris pallida TaxID=29817 RepID=A0AAX6GPC6_IRIPA|nr:secretory carrier-associated membrane protein 4-like [Iris pallida]
MQRREDQNPFEEDQVNPFANSSGAEPKSRFPGLSSLPFGFGNKSDATVDIPLGSVNDPKKKEKELSNWEADLKRREQDIKRREEAVTSAGVPVEEKNWPPFFPIIHHDIAKEIPIHAQRLQYLAFASWLGIVLCLGWNVIAVMFVGLRVEVLRSFCLHAYMLCLDVLCHMCFGTGHYIVQ